MRLVETQQQVRNRAETKLGLKFPDTQPDDLCAFCSSVSVLITLLAAASGSLSSTSGWSSGPGNVSRLGEIALILLTPAPLQFGQ